MDEPENFNSLLRTLVRNSQSISYILDREGNFILSEGRGLESLGLRPGEVVGRNALDMYAADPGIVRFLEDALAGKASRIALPLGNLYLEHFVTPIFDDEGQVESVVGISTDITHRMLDSERLEASERRFRSIIESSPMGIFVYELDSDEQLVLKAANSSSERILGVDLGPRIGKPIEDAFPPLAGTDIPDHYRAAARDGIPWRTDQVDYDEDGVITGAYEVFAFQVQEGIMAVFFLEISDRIRSREEIRALNENLEAKVEQRTADLLEAQEQLMEAEKMSALGRLVAGVAHEINTPVGNSKTGVSFIEDTIVGLIDTVKSGTAPPEEILGTLDTMMLAARSAHRSIDRAAKLIRSFKNVAADQIRDEFRMISIRSHIQDILESLHSQVRKSRYTISVDCPDELEIVSDPGAFFQILSNLIMNTIMHGERDDDTGTIRISVSEKRGRIYLDYRDNGPGLDEESRKRIFEPFYTTRRNTGGTGLGMHIVYNIVTQTLKGTISCPPAPEGGFTCLIRFPAGHGAAGS